MPVIRDIPLSLKTAEVLRRQGLRKRAEGCAYCSIMETCPHKATG